MNIKVVQNVLKGNDQAAAMNRERLSRAHILALNITSAPGSGKTTLLERTLDALGREMPCAVLVGDLQTTRDAERLFPRAADVVQINTGKGCHLSAQQVAEGLAALRLERIAFLFIENVGNMVCPAGFDLGEHLRIAMLSTPEGDDKIGKYPTLFQPAHAILLNKIDLLGALDFDIGRVREDLSRINTAAPLFELSTKTGQGMDAWLGWLRERRERMAAGL